MSGVRISHDDGRRPRGRSRKAKAFEVTSSFEVLLDKSLTVTQDGQAQELSAEEALQWKVYQDALDGKAMAVRKVLKMIQVRDAAIDKKAKEEAQKAEKSKRGLSGLNTCNEYHSSKHADNAMILLNIARFDEEREAHGRFGRRQMLLEAWAVQAALSRPGGRRLSKQDQDTVLRQTADKHTLVWPRGYDS